MHKKVIHANILVTENKINPYEYKAYNPPIWGKDISINIPGNANADDVIEQVFDMVSKFKSTDTIAYSFIITGYDNNGAAFVDGASTDATGLLKNLHTLREVVDNLKEV